MEAGQHGSYFRSPELNGLAAFQHTLVFKEWQQRFILHPEKGGLHAGLAEGTLVEIQYRFQLHRG
jgi:hypothetical protein